MLRAATVNVYVRRLLCNFDPMSEPVVSLSVELADSVLLSTVIYSSVGLSFASQIAYYILWFVC